MTWDAAKWLAAWFLIAAGSVLAVGYVWFACPGLVPLLLVGGFWWARPMSWESEFEDALKRLGKAR